ncbi:MAG: NAD(P)/FAD-dependent oxidoreductase [Theionarchaea archaeon]|nr:NAD(P)/FAD-dependent oxidoreductase [Theionarchaea archaeon]
MITVIGGGVGGYTAAIRAAQLGAEVTLVEKEDIGGTCLHWGCVPAKVFLKGSKLFSQLKRGEPYGVSAKPSPFDMRKLVEKKDETKQSLTIGLKNVLRSHGIQMVHGEGEMTDSHTVTADDQSIPSEKIIIATGSVPDIPHVFQELAISHKEVFELEYVPRSVLIVHGGVFSVELAWFFLELGSQVTLLTDTLLEKEFADIEGRVSSYLKSHGAKTLQGKITSIKKSGTEREVEIGPAEVAAEEVIWMKRKPVLDGVLESLKGEYIAVNQHMQTEIPHIYAVGDVTGSFMAGDAIAQGTVAAEHALGKPAVYKNRLVPKVMYAPEAAVVGLTEKEAEAKGYQVGKGTFPFGASGRAQTMGAVQGRISILSDKKYGEILGAYIVGKGATELIHLVSFAMLLEATIDELSSIVCAHPTLTEMVKDAGLDIHGNSFNLPRK